MHFTYLIHSAPSRLNMFNQSVGWMPVLGCYCAAFGFLNSPPPGFPLMSLDVKPPPGFQPRMVVANRPIYATNVNENTHSDDLSDTVSQSGLSCFSNKRKPMHRPHFPNWPKFYGKGRWKTFFIKFEAIAKLQKIEEEDKVYCLLACLKGDAADYVSDLNESIRNNFVKLVDKLAFLYDIDSTTYVQECKEKLYHAKQGRLSIQKFALHVSTLANKALYDESGPGRADIEAGEAFIYGVNNQEVAHYVRFFEGREYPQGRLPLNIAVSSYKRMLHDSLKSSASEEHEPAIAQEKLDQAKTKPKHAKFQGRRLKMLQNLHVNKEENATRTKLAKADITQELTSAEMQAEFLKDLKAIEKSLNKICDGDLAIPPEPPDIF